MYTSVCPHVIQCISCTMMICEHIGRKHLYMYSQQHAKKRMKATFKSCFHPFCRIFTVYVMLLVYSFHQLFSQQHVDKNY
ncbi:ELMO domain-containing protein [Ornithinibacillus gellani]|nr:ELMO domain-containing protein [Ornithinibacillus gellani]